MSSCDDSFREERVQHDNDNVKKTKKSKKDRSRTNPLQEASGESANNPNDDRMPTQKGANAQHDPATEPTQNKGAISETGSPTHRDHSESRMPTDRNDDGTHQQRRDKNATRDGDRDKSRKRSYKRGRSEHRRQPSKKKRRRRSPSSSSSRSSSTSSDSSSTSEAEDARFQFKKSEDSNKWQLSKGLANYVNNLDFVSDKDIFDNILKDSPVPDNVTAIPSLDQWVSRLIKEGDSLAVGRDNQLARIERKICDIMGPLGAALQSVEEAFESNSDDLTFNIEDFKSNLEKTIRLVGQARGAVVFQRRRCALGSLTKSDSKAKEMIKDNEKALKRGVKEGQLFGSKLKKVAEEGSSSNDPKLRAFFGLSSKTQPFRGSSTGTPTVAF